MTAGQASKHCLLDLCMPHQRGCRHSVACSAACFVGALVVEREAWFAVCSVVTWFSLRAAASAWLVAKQLLGMCNSAFA
jgi:hypothetical protein